MLAVGARIGQCVEIDPADQAVPVRSDPDMHLHLVPGGGRRHGFLSGEDEHAGLFGHPGDKGRIDLRDCCLLGAEAASDPGLADADHLLRNVQRIGDDPANMEDDLGRRGDIQSTVLVNGAESAESFHHCLLCTLGRVCAVHDHVAVREDRFYIPFRRLLMGNEISFSIPSNVHLRQPIVLRMYDHRVTL